MSSLALSIALAVAAAGVLVVLTPYVLPQTAAKKRKAALLEMTCSVCQQRLVIPSREIEIVTGAERALIVRERPVTAERKLGEYRCPYCEATHVFVLGRERAKWLMANPFESQATTNRCLECRRPLQKPSWPRGQIDGRLDEADELTAKHGLVCDRCGAVCCVSCCKKTGRTRTDMPDLMCPRCHRGPVTQAHHF